MESLADFLGVRDPRNGPDHPDERVDERSPLEDLSPQEFCRTVLRSQEYRQSVMDRIKLGTLPPGIERWLWDMAAEPTVKPMTALDTLSPSELRDHLRDRMKSLQTLMHLLDDESSVSVH